MPIFMFLFLNILLLYWSINVKKFGKEGDYLIKIEQKEDNSNNLIADIKKKLSEMDLELFIINLFSLIT